MITRQRQLKIFFLIIFHLINTTLGGNDQRRLFKYLLTDRQYEPLERPVANDAHTLPVTINLALQQIIDFDGKNEVIIVSGWIVLTWNDYNLVWDPREFANIQTVRLPSTQIWVPDILLYNSADEKFDSTMRVNAVIQHNGDVLYVPPGIFKSICPFNIAAFPFVSSENMIFNFYFDLCILFLDTQKCTLKFGSWTFDDAGINLTAESNKGQLDAYIPNAEWDLEEFTAINSALKYDCCPTLYPYVLYTIQIRRRSLYYLTNIIVPCFLISCMTILGFVLAPDSGEKLTLQITILLSVIMFSLLMSDIMPPSSAAVPIITRYFLCIMVMSTVSVVASVLVISIHFRNSKNHRMPLWARKYICYYLAWLLRMKRPQHDLTWPSIRRRWSSSKEKEEAKNINGTVGNHQYKSPSVPLLNNAFESSSNNTINIDMRFPDSSDSIIGFSVSKIPSSHRPKDASKEIYSFPTETICSELRMIISHLAILSHHIRREEKLSDESEDWKFMAMVIDRLCLILFAISMILFTGLSLFSIPNLSKLH